MKWSDVTAAPKPKTLRQFAGLWLIFFGGWAAWRYWHGQTGMGTNVLAVVAVVVGTIGLVAPMAVRWIFTAWMIAAFPIGWTISRVMLALMFYLVFTPVAVIFKLMHRDALHLRRAGTSSYWLPKERAGNVTEYFHQS